MILFFFFFLTLFSEVVLACFRIKCLFWMSPPAGHALNVIPVHKYLLGTVWSSLWNLKNLVTHVRTRQPPGNGSKFSDLVKADLSERGKSGVAG